MCFGLKPSLETQILKVSVVMFRIATPPPGKTKKQKQKRKEKKKAEEEVEQVKQADTTKRHEVNVSRRNIWQDEQIYLE